MLSRQILRILAGSGAAAWITGTIGGTNVLSANLAPAAGTASSWQWTRNGSNISGATSNTYTQVPATDSGTAIGVSINGGAFTASVSVPAIPPVFSAAPTITAATTTGVTFTAATLSNNGTPTSTVTHDLYDNGALVASNYVSGGTFVVGHTMTLIPYAVQGGVRVVTGATSAGFAVTSGVAVPAGGMMTLTALDATPIDPVVAAAGPSTGTAIGASGSGWAVNVVLKGITSLVGTCVPSALTLSVTDPGFDTSGNATIVSRTITGVAQVRRQYPNGNSKMISTDGTNLTLMISLDDIIYSGTTIVSATIGSTFYTGCTAGNTGATVVNSSVTPYEKPLFAWMNFQNGRAVSSIAVEAVTAHRHGTAGQMVACVKYSATDGTTTSPVITVGTTSVSSLVTNGNPPEVWPATVSLTSLSAATMCTVNARVYPWLGDASSVLDLSTANAWPTALPLTPLRVFNDTAGTYGGAYAYVKVGASGGVVSLTAATAAATPFPTVAAALSALVTFNNASAGGHTVTHADIGGGIVRLMDNAGAAQTHTITGNMAQAAGTVNCVLEADPAATGVITYTWSAQGSIPSQIHFRNITFASAAGVNFMLLGSNVARQQVYLENCIGDITANAKQCVTNISMVSLRNCKLLGGGTNSTTGFMNLTTANPNLVLNAGMTLLNSTVKITDQAIVTVGCVMPNYLLGAMPSSSDGDHGRFIYNNRLYRAVVANGSTTTINSGVANIQNLFEHDGADADVRSMNFFADSDLSTFTNYIEFHTTAVGNRASRLYNDNTGAKVAPNGLVKQGMSKYCIWDNYNIKSDTFNADAAGSTGNWMYDYSCGNVGNVSLFGDVSRGAAIAPNNDNLTGRYLGNAWLPSSDPNLQLAAGANLTQTQIMALFGNYTVAPQGTPAVGGNYVPLSTASALKGRVPAGKGILKRDLAGTLRRTDGTGAAGAYESL